MNAAESEAVSLLPMQALPDVAEFYSGLEGFKRKKVLEENPGVA